MTRATQTPVAARRHAGTAAAAATAAVAACLLVARPSIAGSTSRPAPALALVYTAVLVAALAPPLRRGERLVSVWAVAAIGTGATVVTFAARVGGPAPPLAVTASALPLTALAAVAEEALFRRLLYGRVEALGAPAAIAVTALAFALLHAPLYGVASFPLDLGAGLLLSWQRWASGSWAAPGLTHVAANVFATLR
jgi:membrane protease YdiL (CAAX protease family)